MQIKSSISKQKGLIYAYIHIFMNKHCLYLVQLFIFKQ